MIAHYIIIAEAMTRRIYHYLVTAVIYVTKVIDSDALLWYT